MPFSNIADPDSERRAGHHWRVEPIAQNQQGRACVPILQQVGSGKDPGRLLDIPAPEIAATSHMHPDGCRDGVPMKGMSREMPEGKTELETYCQSTNGQVEKDQETLAVSTRAMLRGRNVPGKYWPLALQTAAFLKNRTPHDALGGRLPMEVGTGD